MSWKGKVVIVTGAASGIGAATAALFAEKDAAVVLVDVNAHPASDHAGRVEGLGAKALFVRADVSNERDVRAIADRTLDAFGRIDVLVNNAGIMRRHDLIEDWPLDEFRRVIDVNLTSLFITTQIIAPIMGRSGGGVIVNISSLGALYAVPFSPCYSAAKAGVLGLTRSLAPLLQPHQVRINAILPNLVETPMTADSPMRGSAPGAGSIGILSPVDIARAILYTAGNSGLNTAFIAVNNTVHGTRLFRCGDPPGMTELEDQPARV
jgi:NAD(P)-dependent dehydrogenase (short-subunit alcohol dehydrogenase family)